MMALLALLGILAVLAGLIVATDAAIFNYASATICRSTNDRMPPCW